eukprot:2361455-Lingulodinium_polyedra.AAC.1
MDSSPVGPPRLGLPIPVPWRASSRASGLCGGQGRALPALQGQGLPDQGLFREAQPGLPGGHLRPQRRRK